MESRVLAGTPLPLARQLIITLAELGTVDETAVRHRGGIQGDAVWTQIMAKAKNCR
jgi:hypothetical protein